MSSKNIDRSEQGFTMAEVMMALLILGIGLLGIMALHIVVRKGNTEAQNVTSATVIAEHWMERLRTESTMWNTGPSDLRPDSTPMLYALGGGTTTSGATTGWISHPNNPLLTRTMEESSTGGGASAQPLGEFCTQYRVTTLVPDQVLRAEVRVMWWRDGVARPSNWRECPAPTGPGGDPDIKTMHMVALSSTLWRNPL